MDQAIEFELQRIEEEFITRRSRDEGLKFSHFYCALFTYYVSRWNIMIQSGTDPLHY